MSDYSYYMISKEPPMPSPTIFQWVASYFRPIRFTTEGEGISEMGRVRSERHWTLSHGYLTQSGIDHATAIDRG